MIEVWINGALKLATGGDSAIVHVINRDKDCTVRFSQNGIEFAQIVDGNKVNDARCDWDQILSMARWGVPTVKENEDAGKEYDKNYDFARTVLDLAHYYFGGNEDDEEFVERVEALLVTGKDIGSRLSRKIIEEKRREIE